MLLVQCRQRLTRTVASIRHAFCGYLWVRPAAAHAAGTGGDLLRRRAQLLAENAVYWPVTPPGVVLWQSNCTSASN